MFNNYLIVVFYALDGPLLFFDAISNSFILFPVNRWLNPAAFQAGTPVWTMITEILGRVFSLSLELAAPALLAILMAEMFLGIANRLAPQVQIAFLGMSLKSLLGLAILWAGWFLLLRQMSLLSVNWIDTLRTFLVPFESQPFPLIP
jgi:flagellar biosynthesis protein FliR